MGVTDNAKRIGRIGEDAAADYLESKGYVIQARNFSCKAGEVDIIASRNGTISFVEVKTRRNFNYGRPCEAVTEEKQRRIRRCAEYYLKMLERKGFRTHRIKFDVIEVTLRHTENAF